MIDENIILAFWFKELKPEQWYKVDSQLDALIIERYSKTHQQASQGELWH